MNANLVLALLSKHPHLMYIELAVVIPISPTIANLSYIPKAASLPFPYLVIKTNRFRRKKLKHFCKCGLRLTEVKKSLRRSDD
ncbi:Bgt-51875 [Blumeria graminis f. sp. tritici]|uniref:Bgt-51875 n=1 Tax=Blumeria graminis f. sp. tritici TaxID=62690 RepID=A0A9X9MF78_BLUGR|nr:Bgt-51875 [Blumeria graminis f. sp. tritici]